MSTRTPPPQDVPARRSSEELVHNSQASSLAAQRPQIYGLDHADGVFASPREIVGNILSSDLSGSPLSRAGYDTTRNNLLTRSIQSRVQTPSIQPSFSLNFLRAQTNVRPAFTK